MTRREVLEKASIDCLKELYAKVQPAVDWDDFMQQNKDYSKKYKEWEQMSNRPPIEEYCGPRPYEFYYLPKEVMKEIADSYVHAYRIDEQQNLLDIIEILKNYCENPIIDTYKEDENGVGQRGYAHPDNLLKETENLLRAYCGDSKCDFPAVANELVNNFTKFLDMAGNFYSWNSDLNAFNTTVYLGPSPCSNKETVIKNWKLYKGQDVLIDDSIYIEDED